MATVTITITNPSSGVYDVSNNPQEPTNGYTYPVVFTFDAPAESAVTVYFKCTPSLAIIPASKNVAAGGTYSTPSIPGPGILKIDYNVVAENATNPGTYAHVIHVGGTSTT